jgi:hypothetical protein
MDPIKIALKNCKNTTKMPSKNTKYTPFHPTPTLFSPKKYKNTTQKKKYSPIRFFIRAEEKAESGLKFSFTC